MNRMYYQRRSFEYNIQAGRWLLCSCKYSYWLEQAALVMVRVVGLRPTSVTRPRQGKHSVYTNLFFCMCKCNINYDRSICNSLIRIDTIEWGLLGPFRDVIEPHVCIVMRTGLCGLYKGFYREIFTPLSALCTMQQYLSQCKCCVLVCRAFSCAMFRWNF